MPTHSAVSTRQVTRLALVLACLTLTSYPSGAAAQSTTTDYRLTMPAIRKAYPAMDDRLSRNCPEPKRSLAELAALTVAQVQTWVETCTPVRQAAEAQGIATLELARLYTAWMQANWRMTQEALAADSGGTIAPLPPGALRDNVAFLRANQDGIVQLAEDHQP